MRATKGWAGKIAAGVVVTLLVGCSANNLHPTVEDRSGRKSSLPQPIAPEKVEIEETPQAVESVTPPPVAVPQIKASAAPVPVPVAVQGLLKQAEQKEQAGDLLMAAATLERALHIAPNAAEIYYRLAKIRLAQGQSDQAVQLARKGLAVGNADSQLQSQLQALVAGTIH